MRRRRTWIAAGAVIALAAVVAIALASGGGGGRPARAQTVGAACNPIQRAAASHAGVPGALLAALPVLARRARPADALPRRALPALASYGTGIETGAARLVRSEHDGRAWVVPILHDAPQVPAESLACLTAELRANERITLERPSAADRRLLEQAAAIARRNRADAAHAAPGVLVYTQGGILQSGTATLARLRSGSAFSTGECAGPGHNLLTVSGLAPAGTASVELDAAGGVSQTEPAGDGAYSFLVGPAAPPNRLVMRNAAGTALHTITIAPARFALQADCTLGNLGASANTIPAGDTVIAANFHAPFGANYIVGVAPTGNPGCAPNVTVYTTSGSSIFGGEIASCRDVLPAPTLTPTFGGGGFGRRLAEINGEVSAKVKQLRLIAAGGRTLTIPVFAVPAWISRDYAVVLAVGPLQILTTNPLVESLAADGTILSRSHALANERNAGRSYPVKQLPPGHVTLAHFSTPYGPSSIELHRIFYFGHVSLCLSPHFDNNNPEECARYPVGPKSNQGIGNAPLWLFAAGPTSCHGPRVQLIAGVVLKPGLTAWLRTPHATTRMRSVAIPKAFNVAGPLIYATIASGSDTIVMRDASGATVYSRPAAQGGFGGFCGALLQSRSG